MRQNLSHRLLEKLGREIVFDVFISGDDDCDLEECFHEFLIAEDALIGVRYEPGAAEQSRGAA